MKKYIGVKMIEAEPMIRDGKEGYSVVYPDGYISWSPKDVFEAAYYPLEKGDTITEFDVEEFVPDRGIIVSKLGEKTTVVQAVCLTQFELTETSACVVPEKFDQTIGARVCLNKIKTQLFAHLGFVLQWAKYGLK